MVYHGRRVEATYLDDDDREWEVRGHCSPGSPPAPRTWANPMGTDDGTPAEIDQIEVQDPVSGLWYSPDHFGWDEEVRAQIEQELWDAYGASLDDERRRW